MGKYPCMRTALKRASIENFGWHDLRHAWASWHVQNGTPLYDLQEMGGWKAALTVRGTLTLRPQFSRRMHKWSGRCWRAQIWHNLRVREQQAEANCLIRQ